MSQNKMNRRKFLASGATLALSAGSVYAAGGLKDGETRSSLRTLDITGSSQTSQTVEETRSLDEIYQAALAEGGKLTIYAGGDTPTQQDYTKSMFLKRFPKMDIDIIVDYSKYHDVRLDNQFATNSVVPDIIQLQTVQDFPRWAQMGKLMSYKPVDADAVHPSLRDPDNYWTSVLVLAFSYMYDQQTLGMGNMPRSAEELTNPRWRGKIASSYPHDDDAVLYLYALYTKTYGWDWLEAMAKQNIRFARGSHTPAQSIRNREKLIGIGGSGGAVKKPEATLQWVLPESGPFMAWGQRAAILKQAKNLEAAKLYMNWSVSKEVQGRAFSGWPTRTDVSPGKGLKHIWEYPNGHLEGFPNFMSDRAEIERWKQTFALYFGEVKGEPTPGWLGQYPGA